MIPGSFVVELEQTNTQMTRIVSAFLHAISLTFYPQVQELIVHADGFKYIEYVTCNFTKWKIHPFLCCA